MNVLTAHRHSPLAAPKLDWWGDNKMIALVRRTAFRDCNDTEFDEAVAVSRELRLSPLRKQIYAFVFSKNDEDKRNMVLVVGIDGARAIAARTGRYRPDDQAPRFNVDASKINPELNPAGLVSAEVSAFTFSNGDWHKIVGVAYWDEFAPIIKSGSEDDYDWVDTGETWPDTGKPKKRKKLRQGAEVKLQLDPKKDGWRKSSRHMLAKCAEMVALRKGWPEDLSRVYAEEETHRAAVIDDVEYSDLTPSEMAAKGDADQRLARIGGPALMASLDTSGTLDRIPIGQFADRVLAATKDLDSQAVSAFAIRNRAPLQEFWAHNKTDALELKRVLEQRASAAGKASSGFDSEAWLIEIEAAFTACQDMAGLFAAREKLMSPHLGEATVDHRKAALKLLTEHSERITGAANTLAAG